MKVYNIIGQRFGRLIVLERANINSKHGHSKWVCQCDCGNTAIVKGEALTTSRTKSCGCFRREFSVILGKRKTRHGEGANGRETPEYRTWSALTGRCNNPNHKSFRYYGGRGIQICERWKSYENFLEDMGRRPSSKHSIDRIDNNGDYTPENCRWATSQEQNNNIRRDYSFPDGSKINRRRLNRILSNMIDDG